MGTLTIKFNQDKYGAKPTYDVLFRNSHGEDCMMHPANCVSAIDYYDKVIITGIDGTTQTFVKVTL